MPASEPPGGASPRPGAAAVKAASPRGRPWKRLRRGVGYASYWIRGNVRLLSRMAAGIFTVAIVWATVRWQQDALDRMFPCSGLVPKPTSCEAPAVALRALQLGLAELGVLVGAAAAVVAASFAALGREPRGEPRVLRPLVVVWLLLVVGWLIVAGLSGETTVTL